MAKSWAKKFYNSNAWIKCKKSYIAERILTDGGLCEQCHTNHGYIIHHKTKLTPENINDPDVSLNFDNLMYVCKKCHDEFPEHLINRLSNSYEFDEEGMIRPTPPNKKLDFLKRKTGG